MCCPGNCRHTRLWSEWGEKGNWVSVHHKWLFSLLVPVDSTGQHQTGAPSCNHFSDYLPRHPMFTTAFATWEQLFAALIFVSLVNLSVGMFNLQSPCRSVEDVVLNEISVRIPPSVQQVLTRMIHKIYDALHLQTHAHSKRGRWIQVLPRAHICLALFYIPLCNDSWGRCSLESTDTTGCGPLPTYR